MAKEKSKYTQAEKRLLRDAQRHQIGCPCGRGIVEELLPKPSPSLDRVGVCGLCYAEANDAQAGSARGTSGALPHEGVRNIGLPAKNPSLRERIKETLWVYSDGAQRYFRPGACRDDNVSSRPVSQRHCGPGR